LLCFHCHGQRKKARAEEERRNIAAGNPGDVDFIGMVRQWRVEHAAEAKPHDIAASNNEHPRICICVRKRPLSDKERDKNDHDSVTCLNPVAWIHTAKLKVDGITKYLDHNSFTFDHAFDENVTTEEVYKHTTMPLVDFCVAGIGGRATVFAFGQTGSGKTHTMQGIQEILVEDLFLLLTEEGGCSKADTAVMVSFFEMYGGSVLDLLNQRERLKVLEDAKGEINLAALTALEVTRPEQLRSILQAGNLERTTHTTEANDTSSRSHAICQIVLRDRKTGKLFGKLSLVDLAGSERGADTKTHNAQRRGESAEINTSLLALKECIRALDDSIKKGEKHVPYRSSKLTLILKDCFTSDSAMTSMIATVSPGASAADHSINTLRYADRTKAKGGIKKSPIRFNSPTRRPALADGVLATKNLVNIDNMTTSRSSPLNSTFQASANLHPHQEASILEEEEAILAVHISNIQENAELLTLEGALLAEAQHPGRKAEDVERYLTALEEVLDHKEDMILTLRQQMVALKGVKTDTRDY
jgi:kinesin family member 2/24